MADIVHCFLVCSLLKVNLSLSLLLFPVVSFTLFICLKSTGAVPSLVQYDCEEVSSVLKKYLRELPEALIADDTPENKLQHQVRVLVEGKSNPDFSGSDKLAQRVTERR